MKQLLVLLSILSSFANASIYITITGGNVRKARLAVGKVHPLASALPHDDRLAKNVADQLRADLEFTNLFEFINETAYATFDRAGDFYAIRYEEWAPTTASFFLKLGYKLEGNRLVIEALFFDLPGKKKIFGTRYQYPSGQYARLVHAISEDILREITGERGLFFSRILMVCRDLKNRKKSPPKEVYIVDADGRNLTQLTSDGTLALSPSWSPEGQEIAYTQYEWRISHRIKKRGTVLKVHNLQSGERRIISSKEGMNSGASWSPSGKQIAATLSYSGRPEIYLLNPSGESEPDLLSRLIQWKRISGEGFQPNYPSLLFDVEPSWSPDGKKIVFSSARTGHPMIYIVDLSTKIAMQLTFAGVYNASPAWSPKGDKVIFAAQRSGEGNFDLYLIDPDGNNLSRVTAGEFKGRRINTENPTWAPTGRHLAYSNNESGNYAIYISTLDGTVRRRVSPSDKECTTPSWGPGEGQTTATSQ